MIWIILFFVLVAVAVFFMAILLETQHNVTECKHSLDQQERRGH